jgi:hypothetical protein
MNELGKQLSIGKMNDCVQIIREVLDEFSDESEYFLVPMYILTASAMTEVINKIGIGMKEQDQFRGKDVLHIIASAFLTHANKLSNSLDEIESRHGHLKDKSHNEQLTEKLLKEAGLQ